ncbi:hypothetical protein QYF36_000542 [Acer negundo]|nr:hypothetical protein QYF36_000542 [Acer negundo]
MKMSLVGPLVSLGSTRTPRLIARSPTSTVNSGRLILWRREKRKGVGRKEESDRRSWDFNWGVKDKENDGTKHVRKIEGFENERGRKRSFAEVVTGDKKREVLGVKSGEEDFNKMIEAF